jgi:hypothetical protein
MQAPLLMIVMILVKIGKKLYVMKINEFLTK